MYDKIVKQWDMVLKAEAVGQFVTNFMSLDDIFVWLWIDPETSLCETYVILVRYLHKNDTIYKICSKCQLGITNVADEIINMEFCECFSSFLHKIQTTA